MKKVFSTGILVLLFVSCAITVNGQQVVATSGNHYTSSYGSISWTIGELAVETIANSDLILTQGFHQTKLSTTGLDLFPDILTEITAYPNPAAERFNIRINGLPDINSWNYIMYDQAGKVVLRDIINSDITEVPVNGINDGVYYLRVYSGPEKARIFKIVKQ